MKWYDYFLCIWFAFFMWINLLTGDIMGLLVQVVFFEMYGYSRKMEERGE